jgi:hypothetical protein
MSDSVKLNRFLVRTNRILAYMLLLAAVLMTSRIVSTSI